jgi:hypothetical protein
VIDGFEDVHLRLEKTGIGGQGLRAWIETSSGKQKRFDDVMILHASDALQMSPGRGRVKNAGRARDGRMKGESPAGLSNRGRISPLG